MTNNSPIILDLTGSLDEALKALPFDADGTVALEAGQDIHVVTRNQSSTSAYLPAKTFNCLTSYPEKYINTRTIYKTLDTKESSEITFTGVNWDEAGENFEDVTRTFQVKVTNAVNAVRTYEKVGLGLYLVGFAAVLLALFAGVCTDQPTAFQYRVGNAALVSAWLMPTFTLAAITNLIVMRRQKARLRSKRAAITLGLLIGSLATCAIGYLLMAITFLVQFGKWATL